jgi:transcriptional regulator with XRE-family HTH domain
VTEHGTLGEFLRSRRGRLSPADVGLLCGTGRRQTSGLRREELATLAGVSVDYYIRLEQGRDTNPGRGVLDALAGALRLDEDERAHLHDLALARPRRWSAGGAVRPGLVHLLQTVRPAPAYVMDPISTVLAANPEGWDLMVGLDSWPAHRRNIIRYVFTHPAARDLFESWPRVAADCVADLRTVAGSDPYSPDLEALVRELTAASPDFAELWRRYDVRVNGGGPRVLCHPTRGRTAWTSEVLTAIDGRRVLVFQAD